VIYDVTLLVIVGFEVLTAVVMKIVLLISNCLVCFRPVPQIKALRSPQVRKNDTTKPHAQPQRTANAGKKPDPRANRKDEKPKPVKKEDKKEHKKVKVW
jgi:hypothetical protein